MDNFSFEALKQRMESMQQSPEYQASCQRFSLECARLEAVARGLYARKEELQAHCDVATVRKERASGSTLHRGFYCPSPTYDLIVGNTKRGKLSKGLPVTSRHSHEYGFDTNGKLLYCKWLFKGQLTHTEYLVYGDSTVYGITVEKDGRISTITEEIYAQGKLRQFLRCLCIPTKDGFGCQEIDCESYEYDSEGLCSCMMHHFMTPPQDVPEALSGLIPPMPYPIYRCDQYLFERKDGFLTGYTNTKGNSYPVRFRRKA